MWYAFHYTDAITKQNLLKSEYVISSHIYSWLYVVNVKKKKKKKTRCNVHQWELKSGGNVRFIF